jgi:response regulator of citrate/malate metabolism
MPILKNKDFSSVITKWIYERIYERNMSCNILVTGAVGTGKSFSSLRIAEIFDPDFKIKEQVVFTEDEFNDALEKYKRRREEIMESPLSQKQKKLLIRKEITGKVLIVDEGAVVADSLNFAKKGVKKLKYNLQSVRYLNLIIIFNLPVHTQFLKSARQLMHLYLETARPPSKSLRLTYVKPYIYSKTLFTKEGRELKRFTYRTEDGFNEVVSIWKLSKPKRGLWSPYERYSHKRKGEIASKENALDLETDLRKESLGQLCLHLYENKIQKVKELALAMDISEGKVRKYINEARDALKKLHNLKVNAFRPY